MLSYSRFTGYSLIVFSIGVALLALWQVAHVLLLGFAGILFAVAIRAAGDEIARHLPFSGRWGSVLVLLAVVAIIAGLSFAIGDEIARQLRDLQRQLPEAMANARETLERSNMGRSVLALVNNASFEGISAANAMQAASATFGVLWNLLMVILITLYLSFSPRSYVKGAVALAPVRFRSQTQDALEDSGAALRKWLLGQLVSMTSVGVLTGIGLWLVGVPNAAILGLAAGLLEFVPILGPFVAAIPGVLLALTVGPTTALYAAAVYFGVQQLEGSLIMPLAQKWAVNLPPALGLLAVVIFGVLFGIPGVLLATPLTVVLMVLVKRFHVDAQTAEPLDHAGPGAPHHSAVATPASPNIAGRPQAPPTRAGSPPLPHDTP